MTTATSPSPICFPSRSPRRCSNRRAPRCPSCPPTAPAQALANWVTGELVTRLEAGEDPAASRVAPGELAALVGLASARRVSVGAARQVLDRLVAEGGSAATVIEQEGLAALDDD